MTTTMKEVPLTDPEADQQAAAKRERDRQQYRASLDTGELVAIRTFTVTTDPSELEALERGEHVPGIQAQIDRQLAEDSVIAELEPRPGGTE